MTNFDIRILSDTVCPWCYIGKKRLDAAIALWQKTYPGGRADNFTIRWVPFLLDPSAPTTGVPWKERTAQKSGADQVPKLQERLAKFGKSAGIRFSFGNRVGSSRDSHRVAELAWAVGGAEVQDRFMMELCRRYYEEDGDITSWDMLVQVAGRAGLDEAEARAWLEEGKGDKEVDRLYREALEEAEEGVPRYRIQREFRVEGAQDVSDFFEMFLKIKRGEDESQK